MRLNVNDIDLAYAVQLPPEKAIEYLKSKGFAFSFRWQDLEAQAHAKAFTVAGAMKLDILSTIRDQVQTALDKGQTFAQFKKNLTPELQKLGWWGKEVEVVNPETGEVRNTRVDGHRLRTIYQTNIQSAYMAGRYQSQMEDDYRPYLQYVAILDRRTRPAHAALNDTILKKDDPFWETNYPPNGWRCRCRVRARSQSQVDRLGLKVIDGNKIRPVADKAFNSNPGRDMFQPSLDKYAYQPAKDYVAASIVSPNGLRTIYEQVKNGETIKAEIPVAVLNDEFKKLIGAQTQEIRMSSETLKKQIIKHEPEGLKIEDYSQIQSLVDKAQLIVQDSDLTLVFYKTGEKVYYGAIKSTKSGKAIFMSSFRFASKQDVENIRRKGKIIRDDL